MIIVKISTRPMVIAAIINHLCAIGMTTVVAPIDTPFVASAEPTSKIASENDTPIVVKITAKTTKVTINSKIEINAGTYSE